MEKSPTVKTTPWGLLQRGVHSVRSASLSAAYEAGVALLDIMEAADWSTASTFTTFYHKPVCKDSFAKACLGQTEQRSLVASSEE